MRTLYLWIPDLSSTLKSYQELLHSDPEKAIRLAGIYSTNLIKNPRPSDEHRYGLADLKHDLDTLMLQVLCGICNAPEVVTIEVHNPTCQLKNLLDEVDWYYKPVKNNRWLISSHPDFLQTN